jgi:hypothetical protein
VARNDDLGVELMLERLRDFDPSSSTPEAVRDLLVAMERLRNSAEAVQARLMVAMLREAKADDAADDARLAVQGLPLLTPTGSREEFVIDEIAAHLRCTRVAASHRFNTAFAAQAHQPVAAAWRAGTIDARKVQIIGDALIDLDPVFADTLTEGAVVYGATRTGPQLRAWLARRVIAIAPDAAQQRCNRATAGRGVRLTPLPDGVAELAAVLPGAQARRIFDTLTAVARASDGTEDGRNLDQRRADALVDLVSGDVTPPQVNVNITVPASTIAGTSDAPGELAGYGPITAATAVELIAPEYCSEQTWRRLLTDSATGVLTDLSEKGYRPSARLDRAVRARDLTCRFPGCRRPATTSSGVDLDHTEPWPAGATEAANLACLCRHHHRLKHSPGWRLKAGSNGQLRWTTPTGHTFTTEPWQYANPPDGSERRGPQELPGSSEPPDLGEQAGRVEHDQPPHRDADEHHEPNEPNRPERPEAA